MIPIYSSDDKYLYEILEDYQYADTKELKEEIFNSFCSSVWASSNKRKILTRTIRFTVRKDLLHTELGQIFDLWSEVEYTSYRSITKEKDYASLIRQKVNNLYTCLFDKRVCLQKEYMDLIKTPQRLYYLWLKGEHLEPQDVTAAIDDAIAESIQVKENLAGQKMTLAWKDYKKLVETYFRKMFDHYINMDDYEEKSQLNVESVLWVEDNYCVSYLCKGLDGYLKNYRKAYYGLPASTRHQYARCQSCVRLYIRKSNRQIYCPDCSQRLKKERYQRYSRKRHMDKINE